jgi:predicted metal-dependent enzyme (double-stranded beta helix superfamily)
MPKKNRTRANPSLIATRLAEQRELWEPLVSYDPHRRYYVRLAAEPDFEAWLLTWLPGQGTEWHDHGGSAGAFATLRGTLTEEIAQVRPDEPPRILPQARELSTGSLRPFGSQHLHRVTNHGLEPAVSLHVYAPSLVEMHEYKARGILLYSTESQLVGLNW